MFSPVHILNKITLTRKVMIREYKKRARQIIKRIHRFIPQSGGILDIGTGTGFVASGIKKRNKQNVVCVDVRRNLLNKSRSVIIYDGKKLPFSDNSFHTVLLIAVLHHCKNSLIVLDEAIRVSSKQIIIMEDLFDSRLEKWVTFIEDSIVNWEFRGHPHSNRSEKEWLILFKRKFLKVVNFQKFRLFCAGFPFRIGIFILEKY